MKKQLNANAITNELQGGSAFFPGYKQVEQAEKNGCGRCDPSTISPDVGTNASSRTCCGSTEPPRKAPAGGWTTAAAVILRRSFDFYEDQIVYLTKVSLEERLAGRDSSMNAMLREAVDDYIKKRTHGK